MNVNITRSIDYIIRQLKDNTTSSCEGLQPIDFLNHLRTPNALF